jgi:hypothetical protein
MDDDSTLTRYIALDKFYYLLRKRVLSLPVALAFEKTDVNEGRFTTRYVRKMRDIQDSLRREQAVRGTHSADEFGSNLASISDYVDEELSVAIAWAVAARENAYVSCWTRNEGEHAKMWDFFGDGGRGVAIRSTIRKVRNSLENVMDPYSRVYDDGERLDLVEGEIFYARQKLDRWLDERNIEQAHLLPLFFLDGGPGSFEHEEEYRFVAYDLSEISEAAADILNGGVEVRGNIVDSLAQRRKAIGFLDRHVNVTVNLDFLMTEILLGPAMQPSVAKTVEQEISTRGLQFPVTHSRL